MYLTFFAMNVSTSAVWEILGQSWVWHAYFASKKKPKRETVLNRNDPSQFWARIIFADSVDSCATLFLLDHNNQVQSCFINCTTQWHISIFLQCFHLSCESSSDLFFCSSPVWMGKGKVGGYNAVNCIRLTVRRISENCPKMINIDKHLIRFVCN